MNNPAPSQNDLPYLGFPIDHVDLSVVRSPRRKRSRFGPSLFSLAFAQGPDAIVPLADEEEDDDDGDEGGEGRVRSSGGGPPPSSSSEDEADDGQEEEDYRSIPDRSYYRWITDSSAPIKLCIYCNFDPTRCGCPDPNRLRRNILYLSATVIRPSVPSTLAQASAKTLAQAWSYGSEAKQQFAAMGASPIGLAFKTEVAIHLPGRAMASFLRREGRLSALVVDLWPELFERFLSAVYREIGRYDQDEEIRLRLSRFIKEFRDWVGDRDSLCNPVHCLGLTSSYGQPNLSQPDAKWLFELHWTRQCAGAMLGYIPPLHYPLPAIMRISERSPYEMWSQSGFQANEAILQRQEEWKDQLSQPDRRQHRQETGGDEDEDDDRGGRQRGGIEAPNARVNEELGLALSSASSEFRRSTYPPGSVWHVFPKLNVVQRLTMLVRCITMATLNGGYQPAVALCFMGLCDPSYTSAGSDQGLCGPVLRPLRADLLSLLGRALSRLSASMDATLACLVTMKRVYEAQGIPLCLGQLGRLALTQQEILLEYGHHEPARKLFASWLGRFPSSSFLHQELVLLHVSGVLHGIQDVLVETWITTDLHRKCRWLGCFEKHVLPLLRKAISLIASLKRLLMQCLSDAAIHAQFRRDLNNAVVMVQVYHMLYLRALRSPSSRYSEQDSAYCTNLYQRLLWNHSVANSRHLACFVQSLPEGLSSPIHWYRLDCKHESQLKKSLQDKSGAQTPRDLADYGYSVLLISLFYRNQSANLEWVKKVVKLYEVTTSGRHHRLGVLRILEGLLANPQRMRPEILQDLEGATVGSAFLRRERRSRPGQSWVHRQQDRVSVQGEVTVSVMKRLGNNLCDAARDFDNQFDQWAHDGEALCSYLQKKEPLMPVHVYCGLKVLRFARGV